MEQAEIDALTELVNITDEFIADVITSCNDPLIGTSIILSRLVRVNDEAGAGEVFRKLLSEVAQHQVGDPVNVH